MCSGAYLIYVKVREYYNPGLNNTTDIIMKDDNNALVCEHLDLKHSDM